MSPIGHSVQIVTAAFRTRPAADGTFSFAFCCRYMVSAAVSAATAKAGAHVKQQKEAAVAAAVADTTAR